MKRLFHFGSAMCAFAILIWYALPPVYNALHAPNVIDADAQYSAPALSVTDTGVQLVRSETDAHLSDYVETERSLRLFGVIPLRRYRTAVNGRTVQLGGEPVGVVLKTNGVQIVGLGEIDTKDGRKSPAADAGLKEGDMILAIDGKPVRDTASFTELCRTVESVCELSCCRADRFFSVTVKPERDSDGVMRIGAWVRDSTSGIGTMSFLDPATHAFAALGHGVTDVDTGKLISPSTGFLTSAYITGIRAGSSKEAGELIGTFSADEKDAFATITQNSEFGISGFLSDAYQNASAPCQIASPEAAHLGDAVICTTVHGNDVRVYHVRVIRVDVQAAPKIQGMMIEITDGELLQKAGGIVQGMSGSPLLQDGKLIGVVTHVFISHPTRGYCLYAAWMAEKLLPST